LPEYDSVQAELLMADLPHISMGVGDCAAGLVNTELPRHYSTTPRNSAEAFSRQCCDELEVPKLDVIFANSDTRTNGTIAGLCNFTALAILSVSA
jgi:hypothetical protein